MKERDLSIGVFDSGMGGISVLAELIKLMPNEKYIYYGDSYNAPYGIKTVDEVIGLSIKACDFLTSKGVKAIVVACNTATSAAVKVLRKKYDIPIIGMEPAIKPAKEISKGKKIIAMATPITLKERKFNNLLKQLNLDDKVIKVPAPELVTIVEEGKLEEEVTITQIKTYFEDIDLDKVGAIVLGCTHFIFLKDIIYNNIGNNIPIIDGNYGTAKHLKNILTRKELLKEEKIQYIDIEFYNSSENNKMIELSKYLLNYLL